MSAPLERLDAVEVGGASAAAVGNVVLAGGLWGATLYGVSHCSTRAPVSEQGIIEIHTDECKGSPPARETT